jgi:saccharopine dehydrogenase-like NADP-dependent oxidoreductase
MQAKKILILGGHGPFTQYLVQGLSGTAQIHCVLGLEQVLPADARRGVPVTAVNPRDPHSLHRALSGAFAVVNAQGPFREPDYTVATKCAELGVHYLDVAEGRAHVGGITRLARRAQQTGSLLVSGAGTLPAVTGALVALLAPEFERITEIHTFLAPGRSDQRELASLRAVLSAAGTLIRIKERGRWNEVFAGSRPQSFDFPPPVGRRRGYLSDSPELDLFPRHFGATTVTARVGLEGFYNGLLMLLGGLRRRGWLTADDPPRWLEWLLRLRRPRGDGDAAGGVRVEVRGRAEGNAALGHVVYLVARDGSTPAIAAAPVVALVKKWAEHGVPESGARPAVGLVDWDDIRRELLGHDIVMVRA